MNNSDDILVKFSDVTKQYGDLVVLDKLNLEIKKNEMVSIIGPSGSGKTTVLRALMTLEKIDKGVIYLENEPLTHMPDKEGKLVIANEKYLRERRSKIGMVFQQFNLFPHMTALENCIEAPVEVLGMKKEEAKERALDLLDLVGIFKDTPLLSTIGVAELFHAATAVGGYHYRYLEPYTMVGVIFLILSIPAAMGIRKLERSVNKAQGKVKN